MTKVQLQFRLVRPLDEAAMEAIANAHGYYGIHLVRVAPSFDSILVEYDASRLTETQVEATLKRAGIPLQRKQGDTAPTRSETGASPTQA